jgi:hypothetical protein
VCEKMCSVIAPRISGFVDDARGLYYNMCRCDERFVFLLVYLLGMSSSRSRREREAITGATRARAAKSASVFV